MNNIGDFTNKVICGDCREVLPKLPEQSVDFVLTDPPYLVGYRDRYGREIAGDKGDTWLAPGFAEIYRVLKPDRFCVCFYGWARAEQFLRAWREAGFRTVGHLVWTKDYPSSERFVRCQHEHAYLLAKGTPRAPRAMLSDVLEWKYTGNALHPTQKPTSALSPLVYAFSGLDEIVLDPFCGSGSTLLAAQQLGRRYIGIELDQAFCATARRRASNP